jgi:fatty acid desaturase
MIDLPSFIRTQSRRTNFLSVGVRLCALVAAICAAPLAFVRPWIAIWLLVLMTILVLGTFGIWLFHAIKNRHLLDTEEHTEQMAAISLIGQNREGKAPLIRAVEQAYLTSNPELSPDQPEEEE